MGRTKKEKRNKPGESSDDSIGQTPQAKQQKVTQYLDNSVSTPSTPSTQIPSTQHVLLSIDLLRSELHDLAVENENLRKRQDRLIKQNEYYENEVRGLRVALNKSNNNYNSLEQWTRRSSIRILGVKDNNKNEDFSTSEKLAIHVFNNKLGLQNIVSKDIDIAHRVGPFQKGKNRPLLVKFICRKKKIEVIGSRRKLAKTGIVIVEDLTTENARLFMKARKAPGVVQSWTKEGKIYTKDANNMVRLIRKESDLGLEAVPIASHTTINSPSPSPVDDSPSRPTHASGSPKTKETAKETANGTKDNLSQSENEVHTDKLPLKNVTRQIHSPSKLQPNDGLSQSENEALTDKLPPKNVNGQIHSPSKLQPGEQCIENEHHNIT